MGLRRADLPMSTAGLAPATGGTATLGNLPKPDVHRRPTTRGTLRSAWIGDRLWGSLGAQSPTPLQPLSPNGDRPRPLYLYSAQGRRSAHQDGWRTPCCAHSTGHALLRRGMPRNPLYTISYNTIRRYILLCKIYNVMQYYAITYNTT